MCVYRSATLGKLGACNARHRCGIPRQPLGHVCREEKIQHGEVLASEPEGHPMNAFGTPEASSMLVQQKGAKSAAFHKRPSFAMVPPELKKPSRKISTGKRSAALRTPDGR
jgi:hypothetical protein